MNLVGRFVFAVVLTLLSASSWAQLSYFTLIDTDNDAATGCTVTLPVSGTVAGVERRLTATVSETATPQVVRLALESCASGSFGAPVALPGASYPVGSNNGTGGADVVEQAVSANAIAAPGAPVRLYFAAQGPTSDDLLGAVSDPPILLDIQPGNPVDIPFLSGWGSLALALFLLVVVFRHRSRLPANVAGVLLVGMLAGIAWAAGFRLDGQVGDWQGVSAVGSDARGDSAPNTDIVAAFAAQEGGNLFFRMDITNAETTPSSNRAPSFTSTPITAANVASPYSYAIATSDPDGNALTLTAPTLPVWLTFAPGANGAGTLSGTPGPADAGTHAVVLRVTDNGTPNLSANQTFTITVGSVGNDAPTATRQTLSTPEDTALTITLTGSDPNNDPLTFALASNPANGTLSAITPLDATSARVIYTPNPNFVGNDSFTFTVNDGVVDSAAATVSISVGGVNDPPTANPLAQTTPEDTPITLTLSGSDPDGDPLTFSITTPPSNGALGTITPTDATTAQVIYTPGLNFTGSDNFTFQVDDGNGGAATAVVTITIDPFNDNPVANAQMLNTNEDIDLPIVLSGSDPDGDPLTFSIITPPSNGTLGTITPIDATSADITYTPAANFTGSDSFTFQVADGNGGTATALVQITINPQADTPVANAQMLTINEDTALPILLTGSDPDNDPLIFTIDTNPINGALSAITPTGATSATLTYTPNPNFNGLDSFVFQVDDGNGGTATATIEITINPINDEPTLDVIPDPAAILEDAGQQTINLSGITAGGGELQTLTVTATSDNTALIPDPTVTYTSANATGSLDYTPVANQSGSAVITVTVMDDGGTANPGDDDQISRTFTVNVTEENDEPVVTPATFSLAENSANATVVGTVSASDADVPAQTLSFAITAGNTGGAFAIDSSGQITVANSAALDFETTPSFALTVQVTDNGTPPLAGSATVTVNLTNANEAPVVTPATFSLAENSANATVVGTVSASDADVPAQTLSFAITAGNTGGAFAIDSSGQITVANSAALDFETTPSFALTVQVTDNGTPPLAGSATVTVNLTNANEAPVVTPATFSLAENSANATVVGTVSASDADVPAQTLSFAITAGNTGGAFAIDSSGQITVANSAALDFETTPSFSLTVEVTDNGTPNLTGSATVTVNLTDANEPPVIDLPGPGVNYDTVTPIILDAAATVTDVDSPNFDTGTVQAQVTEATCDANDRLTVNNQGVGAGQISVSDNNIFIDDPQVQIGTITSDFSCDPNPPGAGNTLLTISRLTANATPTAVQALVRNLAFSSTGAVTPDRVVEVTVSDGDGGTSNTATKTVTIDAAPTILTIVPANNATGVAINSDVVIAFSEDVTVTGSWFQIACATSGTRTVANTVVSGGPTTFTINPNTDFANGENCPVTVFAAQVADQGTLDPPDNMATDFNSTFATVDVAPTVLASSTPANGAVVPTNQIVILNFSERVDVVPANIGLVCGTAVTFATSGASNVTSITLTPTSALPEGASCTLTVPVTAATDTDTSDPPNELDVAFTRTFSVDSAPTFVSSNPADGNVNVNVGSNIGVNFSEAVNVTTTSFTLDCGGGSLTYSLSGSGTNIISLDPSANLPGGTLCTVTINGGAVQDSDAIDPPNTLAGTPSFSFTTAPVANDDSYNATPHLTLSSAAGATEVDVNDQLGTGTITGFGFAPSCTGTAPGAQLDAGAANGRFALYADGSFSYEPPAGVANATRTFCYTVTGGDTANITFALQNTELVWFIDASAAGGGNGTQARPFQTLAAAAAVDTPADTLHIADGNYTCGITLANNERVLGDGSTQALAAFTGIAPVTGSAFPTLSGTAPVLTATDVNCLTLDATAGNTHTLRGFIIGDTGATGTDIAGTNFGTLTVDEVTLNGTGRALNLANGTLTATFTGVSSSSGANNVTLTNVAGTSNFGGGALSGATSHAFNVDQGAGSFTYAGTINSTTARSVSISNKTGGAVNFNGAVNGTAQGVVLASNTGATINFSGGVTLSTGANAAFTATGGGTVNVTGASNTITTTTGVALNVASTNIGSSGLTFQSITSNGAATANGIVLDNTGALGGLTITGTGTAGSGGTIANKQGADNSTTGGIGVFLNNTRNVSLNWMQLNDFQNSAIAGRNVTGFTLTNSVISGVIGNSSAPVEGPINFGLTNPGGTNGLQGTGLIRNVRISGGIEHNLEFYNQSGSMNLTIDGTNVVSEGANPNIPGDDTADCIIEENSLANGSDGVLIEMQNTATATIVIDRCLFRDNRSQPVQVNAINDSVVTLTIDESVARRFDQGNEGFVLSNASNADMTALVSNNRVNNFGGTATFVGQTPGNATAASLLNATISNSIITQPTTATNHGIIAFLTSTVGQQSQARLRIDGNNVTNNSTSGTTRGILVDTPDTNTSPFFDATVTNNAVAVGDNVAGVAGLVAQARQSSDACANIGNNTVTFPNGAPGGVNGLRARQVVPATYDLEQGPGCSGTAAEVLACRNPAPTTTEVLGTLVVVASGLCQVPAVP